MDALLVVDMQKACVTHVQRYNYEQILANVNRLTAKFRSTDRPVFQIQHSDDSVEFQKGSIGWEFADELDIAADDQVVSKTYCDAFIQTTLESALVSKGVTRVFVVGCATDFCVDSTIKGAIANGFNVVVPSDAHTTSERPFVSAESLISHFNWNWANLIVGHQSITVMSSDEVIGLLSA